MNDWKLNDKGNLERQFSARLVSVPEDIQRNSNDTEYRWVTVEFEDVNGNTVTADVTMYESNVEQLPADHIGQYFLATAEKRKGQPTFVRLSHLSQAPSVTDEMFGFDDALFETVTADQESEHVK